MKVILFNLLILFFIINVIGNNNKFKIQSNTYKNNYSSSLSVV